MLVFLDQSSTWQGLNSLLSCQPNRPTTLFTPITCSRRIVRDHDIISSAAVQSLGVRSRIRSHVPGDVAADMIQPSEVRLSCGSRSVDCGEILFLGCGAFENETTTSAVRMRLVDNCRWSVRITAGNLGIEIGCLSKPCKGSKGWRWAQR